jgi:hypothetical protein
VNAEFADLSQIPQIFLKEEKKSASISVQSANSAFCFWRDGAVTRFLTGGTSERSRVSLFGRYTRHLAVVDLPVGT